MWKLHIWTYDLHNLPIFTVTGPHSETPSLSHHLPQLWDNSTDPGWYWSLDASGRYPAANVKFSAAAEGWRLVLAFDVVPTCIICNHQAYLQHICMKCCPDLNMVRMPNSCQIWWQMTRHHTETSWEWIKYHMNYYWASWSLLLCVRTQPWDCLFRQQNASPLHWDFWPQVKTSKLSFSEDRGQTYRIRRPRWGWPQSIFAKTFGVRKLESLGYCLTLFAWSYVYPFWYNTGVWQTDRQTHDGS